MSDQPPYTPSLDEARELHVLAADTTNADVDNGAAFDRLIAQVRAEALREAVAEFENNVGVSEFDEQSKRPGRHGAVGWVGIEEAWDNQGPYMDWLRNRADRIEQGETDD